jgi:hypothetical protein
VPERPETDRQAEHPGTGRPRTSARTHVAPGARRACASMPALKSTPVTCPWHGDARTSRPAPVPQHTSSPRPNGPNGPSAPSVASSTPSGVRKGACRTPAPAGHSRLDRRQRLHPPVHAQTGLRARTPAKTTSPDARQAVSPGSTYRTEGQSRRTPRDQRSLARACAYPPSWRSSGRLDGRSAPHMNGHSVRMLLRYGFWKSCIRRSCRDGNAEASRGG